MAELSGFCELGPCDGGNRAWPRRKASLRRLGMDADRTERSVDGHAERGDGGIDAPNKRRGGVRKTVLHQLAASGLGTASAGNSQSLGGGEQVALVSGCNVP